MQTQKLFNEANYKQRAQLIVNNLDNTRLDIEKFNDELLLLGKKLDNSSSFSQFSAIVEDIISTEAALDRFLSKKMNGLNKNVKNILINTIGNKDEFQFFINVLSFNQIITDKILKNKERLSMERLKEELPEEEYNVAEKFIHVITALKPIAELIEKQKDYFKTQLDSANSMGEINNIEANIDAEDTAFQEAYQTLIDFPNDEKTAEAVIKFLEDNQQIHSIMRSFDFSESLVDDVLSAKTRVSFAQQNLGPN